MVRFLKFEAWECSFRSGPMIGSDTHVVEGDEALYVIAPAKLSGRALWDFVAANVKGRTKAQMGEMEAEVAAGDADPPWDAW